MTCETNPSILVNPVELPLVPVPSDPITTQVSQRQALEAQREWFQEAYGSAGAVINTKDVASIQRVVNALLLQKAKED